MKVPPHSGGTATEETVGATAGVVVAVVDGVDGLVTARGVRGGLVITGVGTTVVQSPDGWVRISGPSCALGGGRRETTWRSEPVGAWVAGGTVAGGGDAGGTAPVVEVVAGAVVAGGVVGGGIVAGGVGEGGPAFVVGVVAGTVTATVGGGDADGVVVVVPVDGPKDAGTGRAGRIGAGAASTVVAVPPGQVVTGMAARAATLGALLSADAGCTATPRTAADPSMTTSRPDVATAGRP